jgi:general secretion pathway protein B
MSLILEALKKSERQRRLGESPSLGSPVMAVRRRRSFLPVLIVLILLGLVAMWWLRRGADSPVSPALPQPAAATSGAPKVPDATTFNDDVQPPPPAPVNAPRQVAQSSAASRQPRSKVPADATSGLAPDLREKVKSGEVVVPNAKLLKPGQPATIDETAQAAMAAGADDAVGEQRAAAVAMAEAAASVRSNSDQAGVVVDNAPTVANPTPAAGAGAATTETAPIASGSGIKLMWELPYATRRELPEIKLTMHVYADLPEQRFVIVNGDRQVEGDEVGTLNLVEIRQDGVVFDYEGVRFLYPRGGR